MAIQPYAGAPSKISPSVTQKHPVAMMFDSRPRAPALSQIAIVWGMGEETSDLRR